MSVGQLLIFECCRIIIAINNKPDFLLLQIQEYYYYNGTITACGHIIQLKVIINHWAATTPTFKSGSGLRY